MVMADKTDSVAPLLAPYGPERMPGFRHERVSTGAEIHVTMAGEGPRLLLLLGNPLTHVTWHKIAPSFVNAFTGVAPNCAVMANRRNPTADPTIPAIPFEPWRKTPSRCCAGSASSTSAWRGTTATRAPGSRWRSTIPRRSRASPPFDSRSMPCARPALQTQRG